MIIPSKHDGWVDGVRRANGGDSGSSAPTQQTVTQTNVPEYARPYVEDILGRTQALSTQNVYQPYGGQRVADQTALQTQAANSAARMTPSYELADARNLALGVSRNAGAATKFTPGQFGAIGPMMTGTGIWNGQAAQQYMNPYMQQVVDIQKREAARQSAMQGERDNAGAVGAGAFGGTRHALVQAERERNLGQQLNDIQAQGANAAFQQAQQMFTSDQSRALQSQTANQGAGLEFGRQFLNAQNMGEQSRQFGANLGLQGLQTQLQSAGLLRDVGQNLYNQRIGIAGLQNQFGTQQQAQQQLGLDAAYQDFVNRQMFPYRQLEFANNIVRGNYSPETTSSVYSAPPSTVSQLAGLGMAGAGIARMMAKGGVVDVEAREVPDGDGVDGIVDLLIAEIQ